MSKTRIVTVKKMNAKANENRTRAHQRNAEVVALQNKIKKKGKAIPVTGHGGPQGCETLRVPQYLDSRLTDGGKVVSPLPPRKIPGTHFC
jgi:hypothetical protein